jgi:hypothetical protein
LECDRQSAAGQRKHDNIGSSGAMGEHPGQPPTGFRTIPKKERHLVHISHDISKLIVRNRF